MGQQNLALSTVVALLATIGCDGTISGPSDSGGPTVGDPGTVIGPGPGPGPGTGVGPGAAGDCNPVPTRIWKLSDSQYQRAVSDLLPSVTVPAIQTPGRSRFAFADYADELPVSGSLAVVFRQTAKDVAAQAITSVDSLATCGAGEAPDACAGRFIDTFAARAWRRPVAAEERAALLGVFQVGSPDGFANGLRLVLEAILQSPSFLYRTELGAAAAPGKVSLTAYEQASSLSFFLLDSIPDQQLWSRAQDGTIAGDDVWRAEVDRLLQLPRAQDNLVQVLVKWLGAEQVLAAEGDTTQLPTFDALRDDMLQESRQFLGGLLAGQGTLSDLLTSRSTQVTPELATVYGLNLSGAGAQAVTLPADQRSGVLTQAGIVAGWPKLNRSVFRGLFVFRELLCGEVPSPPAGVNIQQPAGIETEREFAAYRAANSCSACHGLFDPVGLSYENYDAFGRYVTERDGATVAPQGTITLDAQLQSYANVVELGQLLAQSQQVKGCLAQKLSTYAFGRRPSEQDSCIAEQVQAASAASGPQLLDLFKRVAESPAFRNRSAAN